MQARKLLFVCCTIATGLVWSRAALALTVDIATKDASLVGDSFTFRAVVQDAVGPVQYRWNFGDGTPRLEFAPDAGERAHVYMQPGHFYVQLSVQDQSGASSVVVPHLVHYPAKPQRPTGSTSIVYDKGRERVYAVNQDNDSVTSIDAVGLKKVAELSVYRRPEALALAPDGKLWVIHQDDYAVAVVDPDKFVIEKGFRLPYASQPAGLAMSPAGKEAYITLMAVGKLLKLDTTSGQVMGELDVGPWPRGVSVSHDGKDVYVTRFISPDSAGEVVQVDGPAMKLVKRIQLVPDTDLLDTDRMARGLPNYLFSVGIAPDGRQAWVAGKKDNIFRGPLRDGLDLGQDDTVRPIVAILDLAQGAELRASRIDLDDRSLPAHVEFSPLGNFAFVTVAASNIVEVRSVYEPGSAWSIIPSASMMPRAAVLGPQNRLFVQGSLSRSVVVYDCTEIMVSFQKTTPPKVAEIDTVENEKLDGQVLLGKQVFHGAADVRMTSEGYLTCATCHFEGIDDGRVYDFSTRGEGLRNTSSLLGRKGMGHGRVNWTGNLDEIQDFEMQIREMFVGRGFIANEVLAMGTRNQALGETKVGLSPELDALAAYVKTLDRVNPSPFRTSTGHLTGSAQAGKALFAKLGCGFCHGGTEFTDSGKGKLHDVGTLTAKSGKASGAALKGIDSPTLLGVWETAPYLHDGSAPTLRDVLTTRNPSDQHGFVSELKSEQIDQLVAYMLQIDSETPPRRLPFEGPLPPGTGGSGAPAPAGTGGAGGPSGSGGHSGGASGGATKPGPNAGTATSGCACAMGQGQRGGEILAARQALLSAVALIILLALTHAGRQSRARTRSTPFRRCRSGERP